VPAHVAEVNQRNYRFVGVQYVKATERQSHYSICQMGSQFDMVIHIDKTESIRPLKWVKAPLRPGTVDYSKWDHIDETDEEDLNEEY
jgi:hypothetical protein